MITNDEIIQQEQRIINKWVSLKSSAFTRNKEFNLTLISIKNLLSAKRCYYTDKPLDHMNISIDRIDNDKGYIKGNVCACDANVNRIKDSLSIQDIEKILKKMKSLDNLK